jgi:hypothetical protein
MPVQVPPNVQQSITALQKHLATRFASPTRVDYDDRKQKIRVVFTGSNDANRPDTIPNLIPNLAILQEKVGKFEKLLGKKHVDAEKATALGITVEHQGQSVEVNSTSFIFDALELEKLLPKHQRSA